jgi:hypothetical protein
MVSVGNQVVGVLPLTISVPTDVPSQDVFLVSKSLTFAFTLDVTSGTPHLTSKAPLHCGPERASATVTGLGARFSASVHFSSAGAWQCGESPALGAPDTKAKLAFTSDPPDTELWYPSSTGVTQYTLPKTLIVDVFYGAPFAAVIKKTGYFDCVLTISFQRGPSPTFSINGKTRALSLNALSDPNLAACSLQRISP